MSYRELAPPARLRPYVECLWLRAPAAPAAPAGPPAPGARAAAASRASNPDDAESGRPACGSTTVLPDGCVDVLIDLSSATPRAFVVGPMTRPLRVEHADRLDLVAVRFRPGGASAFFRTPLHEWVDRRVELEEAWNESARLVDAVGGADGVPARIAALAALAAELERRCPSAPAAHARHAVALASAVLAAPPERAIADLAAGLGVTRQHLARTFRTTVGVGPKLLQRIARMQRARALLASRRDLGLAAIALEAGYCDQSHLTNDLAELAGTTPARLRPTTYRTAVDSA